MSFLFQEESPLKRAKRPRDSKKSDCPAHITLKEIHEFPENKVNNFRDCINSNLITQYIRSSVFSDEDQLRLIS